ncbi:MAG: hypothetical protein LQ351_001379 [Letrouitia transgressa]|nr:MAG: hypothetical protein LQ351_001379 [Letrouitia transgressa]
MKIIIVGAGISGLTTYLFLKKLLPNFSPSNPTHEIVIYESYQPPQKRYNPESSVKETALNSASPGAALGISPNGLSVLRDLDQTLFHKIANSGYAVSHFQLMSARGGQLARFRATNEDQPPLHTVLISRSRLWECLHAVVPADDIVWKMAVQEVKHSKDGKPCISFADGSPDQEADLVIGADGVWSVVKKIVTGNGKVDDWPPVYEGLAGVGGFIPSSYLPSDESQGTTTMTFGPHGFFGYGACTSAPASTHNAECSIPQGPEAVWWSTYEIEHPPNTKDMNSEDIRKQLLQRHSWWKDPAIRRIIADAEIQSIYPTWTTPELSTWQARGVVLVGDAAHTLQSSSGQGVSQALEDSQVLATLLAFHLGRCHSSTASQIKEQNDAIDLAIKQYFEIRWPRVKRIADRAKKMGDMKRKRGIIMEWLTYLILWVMGMLPDSGIRWLYNDLPITQVKKLMDSEMSPSKSS